MGDYTIRAQFETDAAPSDVRKWLDSSDGIAGWWSDTVEGDAGAEGGRFHVTFPDSPVVFDLAVTVLTADTVRWHIAENPPWWKDTTIGFVMSESDGGGTSVLFTHAGFDPDDPIIQVITPAWVRFLDNLIVVAESGTPAPAVVN